MAASARSTTLRQHLREPRRRFRNDVERLLPPGIDYDGSPGCWRTRPLSSSSPRTGNCCTSGPLWSPSAPSSKRPRRSRRDRRQQVQHRRHRLHRRHRDHGRNPRCHRLHPLRQHRRRPRRRFDRPHRRQGGRLDDPRQRRRHWRPPDHQGDTSVPGKPDLRPRRRISTSAVVVATGASSLPVRPPGPSSARSPSTAPCRSPVGVPLILAAGSGFVSNAERHRRDLTVIPGGASSTTGAMPTTGPRRAPVLLKSSARPPRPATPPGSTSRSSAGACCARGQQHVASGIFNF